jgi:hypothetical protein
MKSILDPAFVYTSAARTDIRQTFRRERERLAAASAPPPRVLLGAEDMDAADLHPRLPAWMKAHAADEAADLRRALDALDADDRR